MDAPDRKPSLVASARSGWWRGVPPAAGVIVAVLTLALVAFALAGPDGLGGADRVQAAALLALLAVALAGSATRGRAATGAERAGWSLLVLVAVLGLLGVLVPLPGQDRVARLGTDGPADLPALAIAPLMVLALVLFGRGPLPRARFVRLLVDGLTIVACSGAAIWWAVLRPLAGASLDGGAPGGLAVVTLTVVGAALIAGLLALLRTRGDLRPVAAAVVVALGFLLLGDLLRVWDLRPGTRIPHGAAVVAWALGSAALAVGMWTRSTGPTRPVRTPGPRPVDETKHPGGRATTLARRWVLRLALPHPFLVLLGIVLLLAVVVDEVDTGLVLITAAVIALVGARQVLALDEHAALTRRLTDTVATLEHRADHDELTGLLNRRGLIDRLDRLEGGGAASLLFLDLDRFKGINDTLGHAVGDAVLRAIARRLEEACGRDGVVARFSGDEFVVLLHGVPPGAAIQRAEGLAALVERPIVLADGNEVVVTASVGIARRERHERGELVVRAADLAMFEAKRGGRARIEVFDESHRETSAERLRIEQELRRALTREDEIEVHLQPLVSLSDDHLWGAEALVRWNHPERGMLAPGRFLPVAEESGLIVSLGDLVLDRACAAAVAVPGIVVSVNLSPRQIHHPALVATVNDRLRHHGLEPERLCLEVTEEVLVDERTVVVLLALQALGVRVAIDDFGLGASSLRQLRRMPGALVKIDRSFTESLDGDRAEDDRVMIGALVSVAAQLGLEVVAEGLERQGQRDAVLDLGVGLGQGWLLGRPLAIPSFVKSALALAAGRRADGD